MIEELFNEIEKRMIWTRSDAASLGYLFLLAFLFPLLQLEGFGKELIERVGRKGERREKEEI